jgi:hypothetical protein
MMGLGGLEPPTSPLSVLRPLVLPPEMQVFLKDMGACVGIPRCACSCCWIFISGYTTKMPPTDYNPPSFYRVNYLAECDC